MKPQLVSFDCHKFFESVHYLQFFNHNKEIFEDMDPLLTNSTERKSQEMPPKPKMTDEELERLLSDTLGEFHIGNPSACEVERKEATPSIPVPEQASLSEKAMFRQQLMMMMPMMAQQFATDPDELRQQLQVSIGLMMQPQKLEAVSEIPIKIGDLMQNEDERIAMVDAEKLFLLGHEFQSGPITSSRLEELIADGTFKIVSEAEVKAQEVAMQQKLAAPSEVAFDIDAQLGFSRMLQVYGIEEKYRAVLSAKPDIVVELQLAQFSLLATHKDLLEVFIDFQWNMMGGMAEMNPMNPLPGFDQDIPLDSLSKLCMSDQFVRISKGMTQYFVAHYKLGSD